MTETPSAEPAAAQPGTGVAEFHRQLATELFSHVLELMERTDRECSENDRMIHMAHASRFHFELGGTALNIALGEWQCARVHIALGHPDSALYHAWRYLEHAENYGLGPFHIGQAHAVLSAAFARKNAEEAAHHLALAKETSEHVSDPEEVRYLGLEIGLAEAEPARIARTSGSCC
ncbi:MAG TPA: hypothetical protein VGO11_20220 [Chthoniobacteraceae bacterium]|nr:hypothetical protein [Chthoniobacteraceae bacterium]